jgi:hypothetical protein
LHNISVCIMLKLWLQIIEMSPIKLLFGLNNR